MNTPHWCGHTRAGKFPKHRHGVVTVASYMSQWPAHNPARLDGFPARLDGFVRGGLRAKELDAALRSHPSGVALIGEPGASGRELCRASVTSPGCGLAVLVADRTSSNASTDRYGRRPARHNPRYKHIVGA